MMEAGVDFLRITRVLRAQTQNPRLLEVFEQLDRDMKMGEPLSDALAGAPDLLSPFAISLIRQGEERNDLAGAFFKVAEFLQQDQETLQNLHLPPNNVTPAATSTDENAALKSSLVIVRALDAQVTRMQAAALRILTIAAGLLLSMAAVWWSVAAGVLETRWQNVTLASVAALFIAGAGMWVGRRVEADRKREARCSFCGQAASSGAELEYAPLASGLAICADCAAQVSGQNKKSDDDEKPKKSAPQKSESDSGGQIITVREASYE